MTSVLLPWLFNTGVSGLGLLVIGAAAAAMCRQPAYRVRVIQCTFAGVLATLVLAAVPSLAVYSLGMIGPGEVLGDRTAASSTATSVRAFEGEAMAAPLEMAPAPSAEVANPSDYQRERRVDGDRRGAGASAPGERSREAIAAAAALLCLAYVAGVIVFAGRYIRAALHLMRLRRHATNAPAWIRDELVRISRGNSELVDLLISDRLAAPITWGLRRPVIVLPAEVLAANDKSRVRYFLAHEWAHVERRDYVGWQLAAAVQFFLYYQPLYWRLRRQLSVSMDQLADDAAAGEPESRPDYAEFLVSLARRRMIPAPALALGISDRGSSLRARIRFLLERAAPLEARCSRRTSLAMAAAAMLIAVGVSAVRVDAGPNEGGEEASGQASRDSEQAEQSKAREEASGDGDGEAITYTGKVTDKVTGAPIPGVTVTVIRKLSHDNYRTIQTDEYETDEDGNYSFTLPPEQTAKSDLYLEVEADHPQYAGKGRSGYSHTMIRKNLELGEQPFFAHIGLWPGEEISGTITSPEGEPLAGVEVMAYTVAEQARASRSLPRGSFDKTKSDEAGRFRIVAPTPGDGVLWIKPVKYNPLAVRIRDRRGDFGELKLEEGAELAGRVVDVDGSPVAKVKVEARRSGDGEEADEFLREQAVANQITRETVAGQDGTFSLPSLPNGEYTLEVSSPESDGYRSEPLPHVFARQKVTIAGGAGQDELELRAVPHVTVEATYVDSSGKPMRGHASTLWGEVKGDFYAERSTTPGTDGKLRVKAPKGLANAALDLITNEHSALRWRLAADEPLRRGRTVKLGTLEADITGMEIVRYTAPIILLKVVDESGQPVQDCEPIATYTRPTVQGEELVTYVTGSHVNFERQEDGRWRSSQALPDEPMTITVRKAGFETKSQEVSLEEGAERELVFVMRAAEAGAEARADEPREAVIGLQATSPEEKE